MSSPCQDFSAAGLQRGGAEGSGTRSSLLWECRRAIVAKKPRFILFENVKALVSYKFIPYFLKWQSELRCYGYTNFAKVMNAKDYGVPQSRERVFMVSILDDCATYHFPKPFPLERRMKDILEKDVPERYYLSDETLLGLVNHAQRHYGKGTGFLPHLPPLDGISSTLDTNPHRNTSTYIASGCIELIPSVLRMKRIGKERPKQFPLAIAHPLGHKLEEPKPKEISSTLRATDYKCPTCCITQHQHGFRIRKLTPREYFRLMDLEDSDIDKIQAEAISVTQQYKMAGNSIVVGNLYHIFRKLFIEKDNENVQQTLF